VGVSGVCHVCSEIVHVLYGVSVESRSETKGVSAQAASLPLPSQQPSPLGSMSPPASQSVKAVSSTLKKHPNPIKAFAASTKTCAVSVSLSFVHLPSSCADQKLMIVCAMRIDRVQPMDNVY
jgi:hypothetical protein